MINHHINIIYIFCFPNKQKDKTQLKIKYFPHRPPPRPSPLPLTGAVAKHLVREVHNSNWTLWLSTYRLQVFLVKYHCLLSLQPYEDQAIPGKLENMTANILTTYMETKLKTATGNTRTVTFDRPVISNMLTAKAELGKFCSKMSALRLELHRERAIHSKGYVSYGD